MMQLWVNLPAKDKMAAPGYQSITGHDPGGDAT
jgi:redox-sensitive bicupin YhaK (pirin superfamily)